MKNYNQLSLYILLFCLLSSANQAQDTTKKTIEITSSFKPVLRNTEKIGIQATPPPPDSTRPTFQYITPSQHILPQLTPVSLKPLSVSADSAVKGLPQHFLKAGFGNLRTPYVRAAIGIPSSQKLYHFSAEHISSSGKIENQDYGETKINGRVTNRIEDKWQLDIHGAYHNDRYYLYGFDINKYTYNRNDLRQFFSTIDAGFSFQNLLPTEFGITYNPQINVALFSDNHQNSEQNISIYAPIEKYLGKSFGLKLALHANSTRFLRNKLISIQNNLYQIPISLTLRTPDLQFNAGLIPSWDNNLFTLLPNIDFQFPVVAQKWYLQGGWLNNFNKGDYRRLASQNPYLSTPFLLKNERIVDRYIGLKGTNPNHLTYSLKFGYVAYHNKPLFVNDTISGKQFDVLFEELLQAFQVQAEIGYIKAEHLSATARLNWISFNEQKIGIRPWGIIPLELSTRLRWQAMKDLKVTSDLYIWQGSLYAYRNTKQNGRVKGAMDMNLGIEFKLTNRIFLWSQFNNIFNVSYQRWNQYQNYGFNMLLGGFFRLDP